MAQITSAMAAKYLRKLNEEHDALMQKEKKIRYLYRFGAGKTGRRSPGI